MSNKIFEALSSAPRRRILAYLSKTDLTSSEIAERFEISKPAISKHLGVLENAGLVSSEKKGQYVFYSLVRESLVTNMYDFLADFCPQSSVLKKESIARAKAEQAKKRGSDDG